MTRQVRRLASLRIGPWFAAAGLFFSPAVAQDLARPVAPGPTVRVVDGDTVKIGATTYRLWGIDAPELHQTCGVIDCGLEAKALLERIIAVAGIDCRPRNTDRYGRTVATCRTRAGVDIAAELVHEGWAMDYTYYSRGEYMHYQSEARANHWGMWTAPFVLEPWNWRKEHKH